jgi:hypothetical protein
MLLHCDSCSKYWIHYLNQEHKVYSQHIIVRNCGKDGSPIKFKIFNLETMSGGITTEYAEARNIYFSKHAFPCPKCDKIVISTYELIEA